MEKKPKLIPVHIPIGDVKNYKVIATSIPQGCVLQKNEQEIKEGDNVSSHLGKKYIYGISW